MTVTTNARIMTPREIVHELDRHIIGQDDAKRAVAIALRNRWRRMQLSEEMRSEITPKNILMIGPTGVGKTEIARRLARLANAPFIKVEATKFTEVGYVGRDVESIIRDLADVSAKMLREIQISQVQHRADDVAEDRILDALLPEPRGVGFGAEEPGSNGGDSSTRQLFRKRLREGELDDKEIDIEVDTTPIGVEIMAPPGMEEMTSQLQNMFSSLGTGKKRSMRLKVKDALVDIPPLSLVMPRDDWFGSGGQGIYPTGEGREKTVSAELIRESTRTHTATAPDLTYVYGYLWWRMDPPRPEFPLGTVTFATGMGSQFILVVPDARMVVVTTGGNEHNGKGNDILQVIARHLAPGVSLAR